MEIQNDGRNFCNGFRDADSIYTESVLGIPVDAYAMASKDCNLGGYVSILVDVEKTEGGSSGVSSTQTIVQKKGFDLLSLVEAKLRTAGYEISETKLTKLVPGDALQVPMIRVELSNGFTPESVREDISKAFSEAATELRLEGPQFNRNNALRAAVAQVIEKNIGRTIDDNTISQLIDDISNSVLKNLPKRGL